MAPHLTLPALLLSKPMIQTGPGNDDVKFHVLMSAESMPLNNRDGASLPPPPGSCSCCLSSSCLIRSREFHSLIQNKHREFERFSFSLSAEITTGLKANRRLGGCRPMCRITPRDGQGESFEMVFSFTAGVKYINQSTIGSKGSHCAFGCSGFNNLSDFAEPILLFNIHCAMLQKEK